MKKITDIPIKKLKDIGLFDVVIIHHGFENYNRDYFFIIESTVNKKSGRYKILFTHCFDLNYRHKYADLNSPHLLRKSWDDILTTEEGRGTKDSYWWGQGFTLAYPGFSYDDTNEKAGEMTKICERPMYAIHLDSEHYIIDLVFHDFKYEFISGENLISKDVFIKL